MIKMLDLAQEFQSLSHQITHATNQVLTSGRFIGGPEVSSLEAELSEFLGGGAVVGLGSGTDALILGLRALGVGPGDEVITTPFTFIATIEAIEQVGAKPVLVDIDPASFNLDPAAVAAALTPKTRALLPVHLYGNPAPMPELMEIAQKAGLLVVEDAAQAIGARLDEVPTGRWGQVGAFSLYPTKNLGAYGDGGFAVCQSQELADQIRALANHGSRTAYDHRFRLGTTSRLDALQAVILRVKLPLLGEWNKRRREIAQLYQELLSGYVETPRQSPGAYHVFHQYTVRSQNRDQLARHLQAQQVQSAVYYARPVHLQPAYTHLAQAGSLPQAEKAALEVLSLPIHPFLTDLEVEQVGQAVAEFF